ncbi:MAG: ABC transporter permease, partial [Betaproteobacteria bacterium]
MSNSSDSSRAAAGSAVAAVPVVAPAPGAWARFFDGDIWYSFRTSPVAIVAAVLAFICMFCAVFAPWVSPHNPFDLASLDLSDARLPPAWEADGRAKYLLGTDDQGRDILSALMYGARISLFVGFAAVLLSVVVGVSLGLLSGFVGGKIDAFIMRVCDVMLSFPSILVALLIDGVGRALFPDAHEALAFSVLIIAISLTGWVPYARTVRGSTLVERNKEYVQAARVIGVSPGRIMLKHVL